MFWSVVLQKTLQYRTTISLDCHMVEMILWEDRRLQIVPIQKTESHARHILIDMDRFEMTPGVNNLLFPAVV